MSKILSFGEGFTRYQTILTFKDLWEEAFMENNMEK